MDRSLVGLAQLIGVFAVAKSALWLLTFLGTDIPLAEIVRDLPGLLLSERAGATIAILIAVQLISPSKALVFGITVGAFQVLTAGLIELGRMTAAGFDWLLLSWALGVETVRPGWILGHSAAHLIDGGNWVVLGLSILMLASPFLSSAVMVIAARRPTSAAAKPS